METIGLRHFTVEEYHRMADAGILGEDDRVELIHGVIREMSPKKRPHVIASTEIRELFARRLAGRASVFEEKPLGLPVLDSEPEPDIAAYSNPDLRSYGTDRTEPLLVIEVADSTVRYDLTVKAELYAQGKIPEYWVVDLVHLRLVVFRDPKDGTYRSRSEHEPGARVTPLSWQDLEIEVRELFPPPEAASPEG
jgi:Uma2 family endonuclease